MNKPQITIDKTCWDKWLEIITLLLVLVSLILIGVYYSRLPEKLPIHFNWPSKDTNGFGKKNILWASPIICGLIVLGIRRLNQYPWFFNYPFKIINKNAEYNYRLATQIFRFLSFILALYCLFTTFISILNGLGRPTPFFKYSLWVFPILLVGIPILFLVKMIKEKKQ
ncbi:MAG: DUF1648 domain-containing protein [Flagellimonas sp.]